MRKPVFGVFNQVGHKLGCTATEDGIVTIYVVKKKMLMSCRVTMQMICAFVFVYAKSRFFYDAAHL